MMMNVTSATIRRVGIIQSKRRIKKVVIDTRPVVFQDKWGRPACRPAPVCVTQSPGQGIIAVSMVTWSGACSPGQPESCGVLTMPLTHGFTR